MALEIESDRLEAFMTVVRMTVGLLVKSDYETLEAMTRGQEFSAEELKAAVQEYGHTLVSPPEDAWRNLHAFRGLDPGPLTYHVVLPLWTAEEGESDLGLELDLVERIPFAFDVAITNIHVL